MNFTDSPYESKMEKVPYAIRLLSKKQLFRKEIVHSASCESCHYRKVRIEIWECCAYRVLLLVKLTEILTDRLIII